MLIRSLTLLLALSGVAATAQQSKEERAKAFTLDGVEKPAPTDTPTPEATPSPAATPSPDATAMPQPTPSPAPANANTALRGTFTLDTPIADLIADPVAKAVLDKDLPGLSSDENLAKFNQLGLRQFQPLTGGQLTDALLAKVARDLSDLSGPLLAPVTPTTAGTSKRNRDASR